ncbi:hypothetical protein [Heliophilum fasciatum]|uniref:Uncharacterized protein n=1 Tax=Heliophilum fasciatum TaxID=35700 RepID=A0A4R2RGH0_9FIRM|nr:hypothetical protein [Heliophilum fasciatum]MCW2278900.1 hypothetical protein [Heliophilum fasciatum]TCP62033.1 hypothetical protein EDD73_1246 [Heliophilum fasciatum]
MEDERTKDLLVHDYGYEATEIKEPAVDDRKAQSSGEVGEDRWLFYNG